MPSSLLVTLASARSVAAFRAGVLALVGLSLGALASVKPAAAGEVFNIPRFVTPGNFAAGLEPEIVLTNGAGVGLNGRFTYGLNDLMNVQGIIGTGSGPRQFRIGGNSTWDFFPDIEGQPGIGVAAQVLYVRLPSDGAIEVKAIPYIHKAYKSGFNEIEPFFAIPIGLQFSNGQYRAVSTAAIGALIKGNEHFRYIGEFGLAINNAETYVSGGIVYYQ